MRKICIVLAAVVLLVVNITAQKDTTFKKGYIQVSLFHPLGTGWTKSKFRDYNFSLNLLHGNVGSVTGVELGIFSNVVQRDVKGLQIGGVNFVKRHTYGLQFGLLTNINLGNTEGVQLSGLWTHNQGHFKGWQFSFFGNTNWGDVYGGQLSHIWNHSNKSLYGIQFALGLNMARLDAYGIQMSATVNVAGRKHNGVQFGFLCNYAGESEGIQFGLVNIGKKSAGLQIGLVNYSGDSSAATIGLINIVKGGYNKLEVWGGELFSFNVSLKTGGRKLYSILSVGGNPFNQNKFWGFGWGFGTHIRFSKRFYADIDQVTSLVSINEAFSFGQGKTTIVNQVRFLAGFELTPRVALFIGPVWSTLVSDNNTLFDSRSGTSNMNGVDLAPTFRTFYINSGDFKWAIWPGIGGGIRFF